MTPSPEGSGISESLSSRADAGMATAPKRNAAGEWLKHRARKALFRLMLEYHRLRLRAYTPDLSCYFSAIRSPQSVPASGGTSPVEAHSIP
jgi:hypothetical protein